MKIFLHPITKEITYTKDGVKVFKLMTLANTQGVRRISKYKFIVTGDRPQIVNLKGSMPTIRLVTEEDRIGRKFLRV